MEQNMQHDKPQGKSMGKGHYGRLLLMTALSFIAMYILMYAMVNRRIAAPMVGGMPSAPLLSMLVIPVAYQLLRRRELTRNRSIHSRRMK